MKLSHEFVHRSPDSDNLDSLEKTNPQKILEEIRVQYPTSHAFIQEIIKAGDANWGTNNEPTVQSIIIKLAQFHRSIMVHGEYLYNITNPEEREKKMYERGLWLASIAGAIYHGELTMIGKDGALLDKPVPLKK